MPRVSDIDGACGISTHHMFLSNCVVQVMRVWSLAAVLSLLAKHDTRVKNEKENNSTQGGNNLTTVNAEQFVVRNSIRKSPGNESRNEVFTKVFRFVIPPNSLFFFR